MKKLTQEAFNELVSQSSVNSRLRGELRFVSSTASLSDEEWGEREILSVSNRSGNNGVLLLSLDDNLYIVPYELKAGITSTSTGRSQSIICDFCRTWQYGSRSASITIPMNRNSNVSFLCCADLRCSMHIRNKTEAAHTSRAQLREDMTIDKRIERLKTRLNFLLSGLPFEPIQLDVK